MTTFTRIKTSTTLKARLAAVFFMVMLSSLQLSAQERRQQPGNANAAAEKGCEIKNSGKAYTVHAAKNFPVLQESQKQVLSAKDDLETLIDDTLFLDACVPQNAKPSKTIAMEPPKTRAVPGKTLKR